MRHSNVTVMLQACELSVIQRETDKNISEMLSLSQTTLTRWRKTSAWQDFEKELIEAHKKSLMSKQSLIGAESAPQG